CGAVGQGLHLLRRPLTRRDAGRHAERRELGLLVRKLRGVGRRREWGWLRRRDRGRAQLRIWVPGWTRLRFLWRELSRRDSGPDLHGSQPRRSTRLGGGWRRGHGRRRTPRRVR